MSDEVDKLWSLCRESQYLVGGEERLAGFHTRFPTEPDTDHQAHFLQQWVELRRQMQVEFGTLLKTDNVAVLLGAGASRDAGGLLLGSIPRDIEEDLLNASSSVDPWLAALYGAAATLAGSIDSIPSNEQQVKQRRSDQNSRQLPVNLELLVGRLETWEHAFRDDETELALAPHPFPPFTRPMVRETRSRLVAALIDRSDLNAPAEDPRAELLKKLAARPLNLKRTGIFTLNYDQLLEHAADGAGIVLLDGFVGNATRVFRPDSWDYDLYFPAETTEGRVHRLDRVVHLSKLHGSVNWRYVSPTWHNPYGLEATSSPVRDPDRVAIYPSPAKYGDTLLMPYAEMFRRLAHTIVRPQATLILVGYGFGDEHVNAIIHQALAIPSVNVVIVDPMPQSDFVRTLQGLDDPRIRIVQGELGYLRNFVHHLLPDLSEEAVIRRVVETHSALRYLTDSEDDSPSHAAGEQNEQ